MEKKFCKNKKCGVELLVDSKDKLCEECKTKRAENIEKIKLGLEIAGGLAALAGTAYAINKLAGSGQSSPENRIVEVAGQTEEDYDAYWAEQESIVAELVCGMETMDYDNEFMPLFNQLDIEHQIEVDDAIERFANRAVGSEYWDSDE